MIRAAYDRTAAPAARLAPRRFHPRRGELLSIDCIRGVWHPSGTVACAGAFAVVWSTSTTDFWAPLHDFDVQSRDYLIEACREQDQEAARGDLIQEGGR